MTAPLTPIDALLSVWRLDALSATFAIPILVLVAVVAVYTPTYLDHDRYRSESRVRFWLCYALFGAGMLAAVASWDLLQFVVSWEVMTLASYVLVAHETSEPSAVRAAFKYFVWTHAASACLLLATMLLWAEGGGLGFDGLRSGLSHLAAEHPARLHVVMGLLFVAFATKAGLYPLGDWLPDAYPAAPAPVTALLSGVMAKIGLYGFLRFFAWALAHASPDGAVLWGYMLASVGAVSALLGGLAASAARDTKVLLAYSSIAQSGLIALGIGAALALMPAHPALAQLGLLGALFLVVSDAMVKALLFLVAGSLEYRIGSRRLEDLGGLFQAMPLTAWTALVACLAIAGFPPLTAFTGKWLLLQATGLSHLGILVATAPLLLVASVLSILYAVKFFSAAFLVRPPRPGHLEVPAPMQAAQLVLAALVVALGVTPGLWLALLGRALEGVPVPVVPMPSGWGVFGFGPASGAYAPLLLLVAGAWVCVLAFLAIGPARASRRVNVWMGGAAPGRGTVPLEAVGFYVPLRDPMSLAYPRLRFRALALPGWILPAVDADRWLFRPAARAWRQAGQALQRAHSGTAQRYIVWQLVGALALIVLLVLQRS
jgi:hydrogenase-4 component B